MKVRTHGVFALVLLIGLGIAIPFLSGCSQEENNNDPNYYTGKDFKGHGGGGQAVETAQSRGRN